MATPVESRADGGRASVALRRRVTPDLRSLALAVIGSATLLAWASQSAFNQDLLLLTGAYALIALGMYVPFVMVGKLSLAYGAYAAMGGYSVGLVASRSSWPLIVAWVLGALVAATAATILGLATRRLSNWYLASVTILFAVAFESWLQENDGITGGAGGIAGIRDFELLGWTLTRDQSVYAAVALVLVVGLAIDRMRLSAWGVTARTVREEPLVVETSGVRVPTLVLLALAFGAAVASLGGALFTSSVGSITPDTFTVHLVFLALFMPLIGGVGTPWGATLGAALVVQLTLNSSSISSSGTLILSVGVILMLLLSPNGLLTMADRLRRVIGDLLVRRPTR
ncbi:branched-chain amino acid ABC transporter permease [Iamia majanohamensis]|uniref:Branched-chain amino acid ABC transporter permease n=1 Tax=Iamia majanohamensis TaxID=467976 RepID=A0AAF0BWH3_9ACTN|nr:branched-chain amino acid ABC transporter permease [Iamia majanohamensis]WCO67825.1 branched-chain amino acid ABC transporter permease [Iamia majanohamensis]